MSTSQFFMPSSNILGHGALAEGLTQIAALGFKKALLVTDVPLVKLGMAKQVADQLAAKGIESTIFDGVKPNPTVGNVNAGLEVLKTSQADFVISLGGGSVHDCAKGIALVASNGGKIEDYEGLNQSKKPQMTLIAINTTAGTASEMT